MCLFFSLNPTIMYLLLYIMHVEYNFHKKKNNYNNKLYLYNLALDYCTVINVTWAMKTKNRNAYDTNKDEREHQLTIPYRLIMCLFKYYMNINNNCVKCTVKCLVNYEKYLIILVDFFCLQFQEKLY